MFLATHQLSIRQTVRAYSAAGVRPKKRGVFRNSFLAALGVGLAAYGYDSVLGAGVTNRSVRSLSTLLLISIDYKLNFEEGNDIEALHERNAQRLYDLLTTNKGLYIKMGQVIAIQGMMFPQQYQKKFSQLFDKAPRDDWEVCDRVLRQELGAKYRTEIFETIDESPVASASIAQVHKARLRTGEEVAVKIQHESVSKQMWLDLATYRFVMKVYEWAFDMPLAATVQYVCNKMREEVDFGIEMRNGNLIASLIAKDPEFKKTVYIPKYFPQASSRRVLTAEWIDADPVGDYLKLKDKGYNIKSLMNTIIKVYSRQVFYWGLVHCDLHPGNLLVRHLPDKTQQLVILDHGLYEHFGDKFRREYAQFWKYTFELNPEKVKSVLLEWGINADDIMLGLSSMDPGKNEALKKHIQELSKKSYFERQTIIRDKMREFFKNSDKFPMTLTFIMRSMRIVQGLNRNFGSPCNRVDILATEAAKTVKLFDLDDDRFQFVLKRFVTYNLFRLVSFVQYHFNKLCQHVASWFRREPVQDLEEVYEKQMIEASKGIGFESVPTTKELLDG
ncbi:hypothetical protein KL942_003234 [Ogataea angusta]|uniref:ABC1 atypical kinase-like domain-containing protein n=1 Tax=Pichia angusta TaxID=870730 RepID=A0ABQ7RVZ6_PICAN|nr:hypothetical protein KL942_003234 [Ogataea angusta]KAG7849256.1 hypothetical protein KL940_002938 [Ogataea angusta]